MVNYKQILEAVRRGIELSLDDFDDQDNGPVAPVKDTIKNNNSTKELIDEYFKEAVVPRKSKKWVNIPKSFECFDVDLDVKNWLWRVDNDNFYKVVEGGLTTLRRSRGRHYVDIPYTIGIYLNDGYLEIRLELTYTYPKNINFRFYFSDNKLGLDSIPSRNDAYLNQMAYLRERSKEEHTSPDWNYIHSSESKKEGSDRILRYLRYYKDWIICQKDENKKEGV